MQQGAKPRYEVHSLPGKVLRDVNVFDKKTNGFVSKQVEESGGFMVYFPNGSSIRCRNEEHLKQLGFDKPAPYIDMETGDTVAPPIGNLKARSEQLGNRSRRKALPSDTGDNVVDEIVDEISSDESKETETEDK